MIIEVDGQQVEVDDSFATLSPEQQQKELAHISQAMSPPASSVEVRGANPEDLINTLKPTIGGAIAAEIAGPMINKGAEAATKGATVTAPGTTAPGAANGASPGQKFAAKTGYGSGPGYSVEEVVEHRNAQKEPIGKGKISSKIAGNSPMNIDQMMALDAEKKAEAARRAAALNQGMSMGDKIMAKMPGPVQAAGRFVGGMTQSAAAPWLGRGIAGAGAGFQGADAFNRFQQNDNLGGAISTVGAIGSGLSLFPHPVTRVGGAAVGVGAEALNLYLDRLKQKAEQQPAPAPEQAPMPQMAAGGAIQHFAGLKSGAVEGTGKVVSSLAKKFGYDAKKLAEDYPQTLFPKLQADEKTGKLFAGKVAHPEADALKKARTLAQKEIAKGDYQPFFDITQRAHVDPTQYPLSGNTLIDAMPKTPDTIAKYGAIAKNPESLAQWQAGFDRAKDSPLAKDWYAMKQLQDKFIEVLGPEEGVKQFKARFADPMGATTGGADPTSNLMTAAFTNVMRQRGLDVPQEGFDVPYPVYGRYIGQNLAQAQKLHDTGGLSAATQPKRHNFSGNFLGHRDLSTLDEQMMSAYIDPQTKKPFASPPGNSYGLFQRELNTLADKNKVMPENFQDITWAGLKNYEGKPMMQEINEMLHRTSRVGDISQQEALENFIRANKPVYKEGGLVALKKKKK